MSIVGLLSRRGGAGGGTFFPVVGLRGVVGGGEGLLFGPGLLISTPSLLGLLGFGFIRGGGFGDVTGGLVPDTVMARFGVCGALLLSLS